MEGRTMSLAMLRWTTLNLMLVVILSGCNYFSGGTADDDADLTELEGSRAKLADSEISMEALPDENELELKLNVGDRFPLMKTVEQRLTQTDKSGVNVNTSKTDMMLPTRMYSTAWPKRSTAARWL